MSTSVPSTCPQSPRRPALRRLAAVAVAVPMLVAAGLAACAPSDPAEEVADLRSQYEVKLQNFAVRETPIAAQVSAASPSPTAAPGPGGAATTTGGEGMEGMQEAAPVPVKKDLVLDLLVRKRRGSDSLPGLTVDVEQVDAQENPKGSYKIWVDTSRLTGTGTTTQVTKVLEDVEADASDKFAVDVRPNVPAAERGDYREFAEVESQE